MPADRLLHPRLGHSEKVTSLSDLEYRVWTTYQLAADDYGVMRFSVVTVQAAHDALAKRPVAAIEKALRRLASVGLVQLFTHQGREYCCQHDWQNFQRVKHPRDTMQPMPPAELLAKCSTATKKLFAEHPATKAAGLPKDFGNISEVSGTEKSELGSLACTRERETANGLRLTAHGSEGERHGEGADVTPPYDRWFRQLHDAYPTQARASGPLAESAFIDQFAGIRGPTPLVDAGVVFGRMLDNLENQKRGYQWRVKRMIPRLDKWLREGLWQQQHDEQAPVSDQLTARTNRTLQAATEIMREGE